ncbi:cytochrome o ubiquinol oxidase subunit III, partial [Mesorhizobium sp. M7A.T.Ca.TU.009.01.3.1]
MAHADTVIDDTVFHLEDDHGHAE